MVKTAARIDMLVRASCMGAHLATTTPASLTQRHEKKGPAMRGL
jgi:hypothetical protein